MKAATDSALAAREPAYYGQPILKEPTWSNDIPVYFFTGGLAGGAALLSFAARLRSERALERTLDVTTVAAVGLSAYCLIHDLGRPKRFVNMLRVFKPTSPMSMGTYIFSAFSLNVAVGFALNILGVAPALVGVAKGTAALLGPALATYTGVLVSDTAVPAWHDARKTLPLLFASGAAVSAAGAGLMFGPTAPALSRTLALIAGPAEIAALERLHTELGPEQSRAYKTHVAKAYSSSARALTIAGSAIALVAGRNGIFRRVAGACLLTGALLERFAVMEAGRNATRDPRYVLAQQT